uniref:TLC domain-containing protein n=1 Tax=viral metagenome TaxID=1070528 RepID=A0A6C0ENN2_9ZZZZ
MIIQNEHMKHRCYFISAMCCLSLYNWYNYSLFDTINNSFFTPYYQNCLLMLFYLGWDTLHMICTPILFRTDLIIHHSITIVVYMSYINNTTLQMNNVLIMECVSLMNYIWKNNPELLKLYRTLSILCIRIPVSLWFWLCYNPKFIFPYWKQELTYTHYLYMYRLANIYLFFIMYDLFILWKLHKPKNRRLKSPKI